ncbi:MAG: glycosyltransferase family 2 protein [Elusimicrobiota bacterium]|nr:glycosyltransferase family 2 protein [Elusimicrobiota bacterium]
MSDEIFLSVVIPVYNEESRIENTLYTIISFFKQKHYNYEIIVVDDNSKDKTVEKILAIKENYPSVIKLLKCNKNFGKGYCVKKGVLEAKGKYIYFTDADLSTPIEQLDRFLTEIKNAEIVIGSRAIKGAEIVIHQPFYREYSGKMFNKLVKIFCLKDFQDTQCGAKLFTNEVAKKLFIKQKIHRFAFDVEILYLAKKFNFSIKEIPVRWIDSRPSKVHILRDSFYMFIDLIKIKKLNK